MGELTAFNQYLLLETFLLFSMLLPDFFFLSMRQSCNVYTVWSQTKWRRVGAQASVLLELVSSLDKWERLHQEGHLA